MNKNMCGAKCCQSDYGYEVITLTHNPDQHLILCDCEANCEACPSE